MCEAKRVAVTAGLFLGCLCFSAPVEASGIEDAPTGVVGLGRAASHVRVQDFMATWQNPANLAIVPGNDLGFEVRLPLMQSCFDRARDNNLDYQEPMPDRGMTGSESFAKVCNEALPFATGNVGWAQSFDSGWGYGIGFFTPAAIPRLKYGDDQILSVFTLDGETYPTTTSGTESPNRFLLLDRDALAGSLAAGVGAQPVPQLRLGLSAALGFAHIHNRNVGSVMGGTFLDQEVMLDLSATDWVIPRFMLSLVLSPVDAFELMGSLTYQDDIRAEGHVDLSANGFSGVPLGDCRALDADGNPNPGTRCRVDNAKLHVPLPTLEAMIGVRYAQRRKPRERTSDPLVDELWDVELNAYWSQTSRVDQMVIGVYDDPPGEPGSPHVAFSTAAAAIPLAVPPQATIARNWNDTFGLRGGGDVNLVPGTLSLRLGMSYETRGTPVSTMNVDVFPVEKLGLHAGATVGVEALRFHIAYAHVFYQAIEVPPGRGAVLEIVSTAQDAALPINEGRFTAALDVISIGGSARF